MKLLAGVFISMVPSRSTRLFYVGKQISRLLSMLFEKEVVGSLRSQPKIFKGSLPVSSYSCWCPITWLLITFLLPFV